MKKKEPNWDSFLDPGIAEAVKILNQFGIETFESCQGGEGHSYPEPTIRFHGEFAEGFKALAVALEHALPVFTLRRIWRINRQGEPEGPDWELVFTNLPHYQRGRSLR